MNPYTRAHVRIPAELSEGARMVLIRNLEMLYQGVVKGHPSHGRYIISTNGQWELEIETKLRTGLDYHGPALDPLLLAREGGRAPRQFCAQDASLALKNGSGFLVPGSWLFAAGVAF